MEKDELAKRMEEALEFINAGNEIPGGQLSDKLVEVINANPTPVSEIFDALGITILEVLKNIEAPEGFTRRDIIDSWVARVQEAVNIFEMITAQK